MKCFYHNADLDGKCAGAIVNLAYPHCEMLGINYGDPFPWDSIDPDEVVVMVDFSLEPFDQMVKLASKCHLWWIDHHKSAIEEAKKVNFICDANHSRVEYSGCELTWELLGTKVTGYNLFGIKRDNGFPLTVSWLGKYDRWDWQSNPDILTFQYGMRFQPVEPSNHHFWKIALGLQGELALEKLYNQVMLKGDIIRQYEKATNDEFAQKCAFESTVDGKRAICVNKGFVGSLALESVFDPSKHDIMVTFYRGKKEWTISMYSPPGGPDVGSIAKSFGGGGHNNAAGFQCLTLPLWLEHPGLVMGVK